MCFNENLKKIRKNRGITQKSLGSRIGVTPVTVGNWERGVREPSLELLVKIADALTTSTDDLLGRQYDGAETALYSIPDTIAMQYEALDTFGKNIVETVCRMEYDRVNHEMATVKELMNTHKQQISKKRYIPYYLSPPAAGYGTPLEGTDFEMILADHNVPEDADYALCISGDSMEPYLHDGEMVFISEEDRIVNGDVGIFSVNGEMYCKQYYVDDERNLHLLSTNPDRADASVHILHDSGYTVKCCGKVILNRSIPLASYYFD